MRTMDTYDIRDVGVNVNLSALPLDTPPQTTDEKLDELLTLLRPLGPALEQLPELMTNIAPLIEGAKKSPVLRMLGITIP